MLFKRENEAAKYCLLEERLDVQGKEKTGPTGAV